MTTGLRIWDPRTRKLKLDLTTRMGNILSAVGTGTSNGYVEDNRLGEGTPFYTVYNDTGNIAQPMITISNATGNWRLSWAFPTGATPVNNIITYGVY